MKRVRRQRLEEYAGDVQEHAQLIDWEGKQEIAHVIGVLSN